MTKIKILIYTIKRNTLLAKKNKETCRSCEETIDLAKKILEEISSPDVKLELKTWRKDALLPLGYVDTHPPVLLIDGEFVSQSVAPDRDYLKSRIIQALDGVKSLSHIDLDQFV
ncbi:MAG: hypothetical protein HY619_05235 [Thaumarchaeota archaeon]|nr:hypothetical protein [Nitrososphaerota archaeon]